MRSKHIEERTAKDKGFTLIEVIVTLIIASILAAMMVSFMGTTMAGSVQPLVRVQQTNTAGQVMENITTDYNKLTSDDSDNGTSIALSTLQTRVQAGATDNSYYGAFYTIGHNDFVTLNSDGTTTPIADTSGENRTLRVSITQGSNTFTSLFTR
jgi:prepilin-type N-terminal cleavage/methylation domain-containing protein